MLNPGNVVHKCNFREFDSRCKAQSSVDRYNPKWRMEGEHVIGFRDALLCKIESGIFVEIDQLYIERHRKLRPPMSP